MLLLFSKFFIFIYFLLKSREFEIPRDKRFSYQANLRLDMILKK